MLIKSVRNVTLCFTHILPEIFYFFEPALKLFDFLQNIVNGAREVYDCFSQTALSCVLIKHDNFYFTQFQELRKIIIQIMSFRYKWMNYCTVYKNYLNY